MCFCRAFIITINSFGTELTKDDREKLYPTCGRLYPDGLKALARADDYDQVLKREFHKILPATLFLFLSCEPTQRRVSGLNTGIIFKGGGGDFL